MAQRGYPEAWDMLMFGLRLGTDPRVMVTTTPRPTRLLRNLVADPTTAITRGSTYENRANLAGAFLEQIVKKYEGTRRLPEFRARRTPFDPELTLRKVHWRTPS